MIEEVSSFCASLRERRIRAGLTQDVLARRAGVSVRTIRYIEDGTVRRPRADSIRRLAAAIGPAESQAGLHVAVLGPLTAGFSGQQLELGPAKQRILLALLALHPGQVVTHDEIVDTVWGERPPRTRQDLVHAYVSRLRRVLRKRSVIQAVRDGGYRLAVTAVESDVRRFRQLTADAAVREPEAALPLWAEALACWRGRPAADVPGPLPLHPTTTGLAQERIDAALQFADTAFAVRRPGFAVAPLRTLTASEPLHEGLHARLMLALAGSSQQSAALRLHADISSRLDEELGVRPGPELEAAHQRVLRGDWPESRPDPVRVAPPPVSPRTIAVPAQLPPAVTAFTGRAEALTALDGLTRSAAEATVAVVVGTAGVGKTALALHWAHRVAARFDDGILYVNLRGFAPGLPLGAEEALELLLRGLGVPGDRVPADLESRSALYRTMLAGRRMLIVLDNALDAAQVRPLLPGRSGSSAVVTSRIALDGLVAVDGAERIDLDVLSEPEALTLLRALLGHDRVAAEPGAAKRLVALCARLPLALRIAAATIGSQSIARYAQEVAEDRLSALAVRGDPQAIVATQIGRSYARLTARQRRLFRLLGLVPGQSVAPSAAAALVGVAEPAAAKLVRQLAAAHLVEQHDGGWLTFHDLLKAYAVRAGEIEDSAADRTAAVRRLADWYLRTATAAADRIDPHRRQLPEPPRYEREFGGYEDAMAWLEAERGNLLALITECTTRGWDPLAWQLPHTLWRYFYIRSYTADWVSTHELALAAARRAGDRWAEAETLTNLAVCRRTAGQPHLAAERFHQALKLWREIEDHTGEAMASNSLGIAYFRVGEHDLAIEHYARAAVLFERTGDVRGQSATANNVGVVLKRLGRYREALRYLYTALDLSARSGEQHAGTSAWDNIGTIHESLGEHARAIECHERAIALQRAGGDEEGEMNATANLAVALGAAGRHDEAFRRLAQALDIAGRIGDDNKASHVHNSLGETHLVAGNRQAALAAHQDALARAQNSSDRYEQARAHHGIARAAPDPATARRHRQKAIELYDQLGAAEATEARAEQADVMAES
ncbi:tetratricopeptide repeat protein [Amycolatopsis kentuckyensis]|uniref:tetratricopeptide repeat protein n=1 Tax=Amycolatopsis kentuckyensis TaxID=218823 RepID=UPI000A3C95D0|nr:tetratricopeptide repeat protein [Amycolatopsis kentuckyensis]